MPLLILPVLHKFYWQNKQCVKQMQETLQTKNISYGSLKVKQYSEVTYYLGCILDESLLGESVARNVVSKINTPKISLSKRQNFVTTIKTSTV